MITSASFGSWSSLFRSRRMAFSLRIAALSLLLLFVGYELFQNLLAAHAQYPPVHSTIFLDTIEPTFPLTTNSSHGTLAYSVANASGTTLTQGQIAVTDQQTSLTLPRLPDDYYLLQVTDHTGQSPTSQTIPFVVLAPFSAQADSPLGMGVHFTGGNNPGLAPLIAAMGATTVRDDASWSLIERSRGNYSFNNFDTYMQTLQQNTLSPLLILDYRNSFYDNNQTPYDNAGLRAFASYAQALVTHYGPQLRAVEVYNEYNGTLSNGPCARNAACYVNLLRYTYQAIKAVRPDVTVVGGAAFMNDTNWFTQVFKDGGLAYMDALSDHPYTSFYIASPEIQGLEGSMLHLRQLMQQYNHGQAKPLWITELGWTTSTLHVSEQTQANYVVRGTVLSLAAGAQKIFWYDFLNDGTDSFSVQQNFGLINRLNAQGLYTPKLAYAAYAVMARELAGRQFIARESVAPGIFSMHFSGDLRVLWTTPVPQSVALTTNNSLTLVSLSGHVETLRPVNGQIVLHLSAQPLYIQGSISHISWHFL
ncbi:MAG TPA: glycosyl hydrolase [Ktedonobacteraceae bacterium]